jgi:DNA-binding GntR family transcriptional regulator
MSTKRGRSTQAGQAYEEIRRRILILEIPPEARLKEEEWSAALQVGRLAVREALTRLHGEGLLVRGEKGGFFAGEMSARDIHEIREVREVLEVAALRLAAERLTAAQLRELEETCDDFAHMVAKDYPTGACEADRKFHQLIVAAAGNSRLARAYDLCHIPLFHVRLGRSRAYMDDYAQTEREHRAIVKALRARDTAAAVRLLRQHFSRGEKVALGTGDEE